MRKQISTGDFYASIVGRTVKTTDEFRDDAGGIVIVTYDNDYVSLIAETTGQPPVYRFYGPQDKPAVAISTKVEEKKSKRRSTPEPHPEPEPVVQQMFTEEDVMTVVEAAVKEALDRQARMFYAMVQEAQEAQADNTPGEPEVVVPPTPPQPAPTPVSDDEEEEIRRKLAANWTRLTGRPLGS